MIPDDQLTALVEQALSGTALAAIWVCMRTEHAFEGRMVGHRLIGRCARCGVGILTDGSEDREWPP